TSNSCDNLPFACGGTPNSCDNRHSRAGAPQTCATIAICVRGHLQLSLYRGEPQCTKRTRLTLRPYLAFPCFSPRTVHSRPVFHCSYPTYKLRHDKSKKEALPCAELPSYWQFIFP